MEVSRHECKSIQHLIKDFIFCRWIRVDFERESFAKLSEFVKDGRLIFLGTGRGS